MDTRNFLYIRLTTSLVLGALICIASPAYAAAYDPSDENGVEVLSAGPVHEAFAEMVAFDPEPGITVPTAPPDPINEIAPEPKPEGNVEWIPGYWAWDDDRHDFIWVSGIWRAIPPGRKWVPGYWSQTDTGVQWISGYWGLDNEVSTKYLPGPPASLEVGPNVPAPSSAYGWVPGCWIWINSGYVWRPGYWTRMRPDWVWVPAHYVWRPLGVVFISGYWDFAVSHRGILFAPVFFPYRVTVVSHRLFTPSYVIDLTIFSDLIFWRPRYHHYYFGDYYASKYYRRGIYPWCSFHAKRHGYNPIYAHERWVHRLDRNWEHRIQAKYDRRRKNPEPVRWVHKKNNPRANGRESASRFPQMEKRESHPAANRSISNKTHGTIDSMYKKEGSVIERRKQLKPRQWAEPAEKSRMENETHGRSYVPSTVMSKPAGQVNRKRVTIRRSASSRREPAAGTVRKRSTDSINRRRIEQDRERAQKGTRRDQISRPTRAGSSGRQAENQASPRRGHF